MPTTYRKKPLEIEAVQWDGRNLIEIMQFVGKDMEYFNRILRIFTLGGPLVAKKGDYIIKDVKGEFYPCSPDIFEMVYEKVEKE